MFGGARLIRTQTARVWGKCGAPTACTARTEGGLGWRGGNPQGRLRNPNSTRKRTHNTPNTHALKAWLACRGQALCCVCVSDVSLSLTLSLSLFCTNRSAAKILCHGLQVSNTCQIREIEKSVAIYIIFNEFTIHYWKGCQLYFVFRV